MKAWTCRAHPVAHGTFLQSGIEQLQKLSYWARRGLPGLVSEHGSIGQPAERFACPMCVSRGHDGFVRPATAAETAEIERRIAS